MVEEKKRGKAQTVTGSIDGDKLGITLTHEHLFIDASRRKFVPTDPEEKKLARQKITMENLWYARYYKLYSEDNIVLDDEDLAIREVRRFKEAGGSTIVDVTSNNIGRNPEGLARVSKTTGLNIIMGTGYYLASSYTPEMKMDSKTEQNIADDFIRDITVGVGDTHIKAGIIGEIGMSWPMEEQEIKVLRAAAIAQQKTGVTVNIHPGIHPGAPFECISILENAGADLSRVVISHVDRTLPISARRARAELAAKGCYLEMDLFGHDIVAFPHEIWPHDVPNDSIRINEIMELIDDGFLDRILMSHDICFKVLLRHYGGGGYSHILKFVVSRMRAKGMTEEKINTILVENPKRVCTLV